MIMKANKQIGFIYKNEESIDKILKDGEVVFERGFLREKTSTTLPITFGGVGKDLKDYKVYGNTVQSKLPSGYTQVDYIESSGTQYIDTGYKLNGNSEIYIDYMWTSVSPNEIGMIFGVRENNDKRGFMFGDASSNNSFPVAYYGEGSTSASIAKAISTNSESNKMYNLSVKDGQFNISELGTISFTKSTFSLTNSMYIFCGNQNSSPSYKAKARIYKFNIYENDTLTRKFIPCYRNSDNEVGLYDLVNNVFYTNQGTGVFTYGSVAPTPDTPIDMVSCGDLITDSQDENYGKYKIPVNVRNDNLAYMKNGTFTYAQNTFTILDNHLKINSTKKGADSFILFSSGNTQQWAPGQSAIPNIEDKYLTKNGGTYSIHIKANTTMSGTINLYIYKSSNTTSTTIRVNSRIDYTQTITLNDDEHIKNIGLWTTGSNNFENYDLQIQINEGATATDFQPYYNETTNIYLNEPLRKIDEYSDYIDFINGKVVRNIKEIVLNGSENWLQASSQYTGLYSAAIQITDMLKNLQNDSLLSNYFKGQSYESQTQGITKTSNNNYIAIRIDNTIVNSVANFKTWLSENNVTVDYVLATSTEEDIELPNIPTVDGNNTLNIETEITPSQVYIKYKSNT